MLFSNPNPDDEHNDTYYDPPTPANRKLWGPLFYLPILFAFCLWSYSELGLSTSSTARTAGLMMAYLFLPFSYIAMSVFYAANFILRFAISRQPVSNFWLRLTYFVFVFEIWYYSISIFYPINKSIYSLFDKLRSNDSLSDLILFFLISIAALAVLLKAHMTILNYRREYDVADETQVVLWLKVTASIMVLSAILILNLF